MWNILTSMVNKIRKAYENHGVESIVDSDGILWLNQKYIKEGLGQQHLRMTTVKHLSDHRQHGYEVLDEPKSNFYMQRIRRRLVFKEYDVILTKRAINANKNKNFI